MFSFWSNIICYVIDYMHWNDMEEDFKFLKVFKYVTLHA